MMLIIKHEFLEACVKILNNDHNMFHKWTFFGNVFHKLIFWQYVLYPLFCMKLLNVSYP